jgi:hypothetical protein
MNDSNLQQMLLNTEVNPPEMVWEKIAVDLNELAADKPLQQHILQLEEEAPSFVWEQLEPALDDLSIQKKINSVEETVPATAWAQIEQQLNIEQNDAYIAATLRSTEITPPATAWSAIEESLEEKGAKVISINRNSPKRFLRMAAAAAVIGVLAWGGYRLLNTNETAEAPAIAAADPATKTTEPAVATKPDSNIAVAEPTAETTSSRSQIKERIKQKLASPDALAYAETPDHSLENNVAYQGIHHKQAETKKETSGFSESQYFMVLNDNGELVRVSKKISNLKCAVGNADAATALQSKDCNEQIKLWREKMAMAAAISASAGDIDLNALINSTDQQ